jgi:hypothetical protein
LADICSATSFYGASPKVNAYLLTVGGLGAPKLAEARRLASRPVLHCSFVSFVS